MHRGRNSLQYVGYIASQMMIATAIPMANKIFCYKAFFCPLNKH